MLRSIAVSLVLSAAACAVAGSQPMLTDASPTQLPRVVLIGDSIRGGYQPLVERKLTGVAEVVGPGGSTSRSVLENLDAWILSRNPAVVHINCGLHDCYIEESGQLRVPLDEYRVNLTKIFDRLSRESRARIVWATTTPVIEERQIASRPPNGYGRLVRRDSDVRAYNAVSVELARSRGIEVHDLYGVVMAAGRDTLLGHDGIHYTDAGNEVLARAVAEIVRARLGRAGGPDPARLAGLPRVP